MDFTIKVFDKEYNLSTNKKSSHYNNGFFCITIHGLDINTNTFVLYIPNNFFHIFYEVSNKKYDFFYDHSSKENYVNLSSEDISDLEKHLEQYLYLIKKEFDSNIEWIKKEFGVSFSSFEAMKEII